MTTLEAFMDSNWNPQKSDKMLKRKSLWIKFKLSDVWGSNHCLMTPLFFTVNHKGLNPTEDRLFPQTSKGDCPFSPQRGGTVKYYRVTASFLIWKMAWKLQTSQERSVTREQFCTCWNAYIQVFYCFRRFHRGTEYNAAYSEVLQKCFTK